MTCGVVLLESNAIGADELLFRRSPSLVLRPALFTKNPAWRPFLAEFDAVQIPDVAEGPVLAALDGAGRNRVVGVWCALARR